MALVLADRVRESSTTTGTGTISLAGAVTGFASFAEQIGDGNTTYYTIADATSWEVGVGTYSANTLTRDTVLDSSNAGSKVNFAAGLKDVFVTLPAEKVATTDTLGTMSTQNANNVAITGGSISGVSGVVASVTGTAPVVSSGGNTPAISMAAATTLVDGYLTSADWATFNGKQAALVSGTNIKTVNSNSLLGSGNVSVGTVTSVGGTGTVNGLSLSGTVTSSGNLTFGGTLDLSSPPAIGGTAASTGAFTTLSASSTVSGAGFSTYLASPPAIGGTAPAAGTFTTLAVAGSLQNLFLQSQTFNTSPWGGSQLTINQTATTAPDSTTTGNSVIPTAVSAIHRINQPSSITSGITYTASVYAKANGYNYLFFNCDSAFNAKTTFNLSTGAISATGSGSATITSVGSGWYRCTITGVATASNSSATLFLQVNSTVTAATDDTFTGNGTSGIYLWGAQLETSPTVHAYQVTTTVVASANPVISLSGGGTVGLQSDGSLYVQPAGTGALQAQATTSTATGGNARGANAVDWQTSRTAANLVASGGGAVIAGGLNNRANGFYSSVSGGVGNQIAGAYGVISSGNVNTASSDYCAIVGGASNTAAGLFNFIGAGYTNSGTASAAVTTQSATMNGTTAVTLSGSNASIKVGQYIQGTSIANYTYVAAISGTSLTLSQAASGSSTSTLSFYTPHGVVVGGGNNQATGAYSFIGGGGDAGTAANRNVASGDWSVVNGGNKNTASGLLSTVAGGLTNIASGEGSFVGGGGDYGSFGYGGNTASGLSSAVLAGYGNQATASHSSVLAGGNNQASGNYSAVIGGYYNTTRGLVGITVFGSRSSLGSTNGQAQCAIFTFSRQTTDATPSVLTCDNSTTASGTNQVILPNNSAYYFRGEVVAGVTGGGNTKGWYIEGVIKRGSGVGTAALVGTPTVTSLYADVGASTWTIGVTADTTNGGLAVTFTGQASTTIRCVAQIRTTEMTY